MAQQTTQGFAEDVTIEDRVIKSTVQDLEIPDGDFAAFLLNVWNKAPEATALIDAATGQRYTGMEIVDACERIAAGFQAMGLEPGDIVAFASVNSVDLVMAFIAVIFAGAKITCVKTAFNESYGLTEACCAIAHTRGQCHDFKTAGIPMPYVSIKVVDVHTGEKLSPEECGEICVKGPTCFKGYLDAPEATAAVFDDEGFVRTGDTGYYSSRGELYVLDRIKDIVRCMDQQVAPAELEELLQERPDVTQAAVAGVPHPEYGEAPRAFVVLEGGRQPATKQEGEAKKAALAAYLKGLVAPHKQLHGGIEFVDVIPQTETGKPHRRQLRDAYLQRKEAATVP